MSTDASKPAVPLSKTRRAGAFLFLSGQLPRTPQGGMCNGTIEEQTRQAIANMQSLLHAEGLDLGDVVKATVWLTSAEHMAGMNAVYAELFAPPYPTRSTVVSGLVAEADIEIEAVAFDPQAA